MNTAHQDFRWDGPADRDTVGEVRRTIQGWGAQAGLPAELIAELALASYEAMANAVEHAYSDGVSGPLSVRVSRDDQTLVVVVSDQGRWRPLPRTPPALVGNDNDERLVVSADPDAQRARHAVGVGVLDRVGHGLVAGQGQLGNELGRQAGLRTPPLDGSAYLADGVAIGR